MSSLQKMQKKGLNPNFIIEIELASIRWQLRFLGEALPEWVKCGAGHSEDAAAGIGHVLDNIADQLEAVSDFWEGQHDAK